MTSLNITIYKPTGKFYLGGVLQALWTGKPLGKRRKRRCILEKRKEQTNG